MSYSDGHDAGIAVLLHVLLTNASTHPVHLLAFDLSVEVRGGWSKTERMLNRSFTLPTLYLSDRRWAARLAPEHLLDGSPKQVSHGAPLMGFLMFFLPDQGAGKADIGRYRLTVTDIFGGREHLLLTAAAAKAWQESPDTFNVIELFRFAGVPVEPIRAGADADTETLETLKAGEIEEATETSQTWQPATDDPPG